MLLVLFRSHFSDEVGEEYNATEEHLAKRVREMVGSDLVQVKRYQSEDGDEHLALVWWRDPETLEKWRNDPEHQVAQQLGRDVWYSSYELTVAEVIRTSSSDPDASYPSE